MIGASAVMEGERRNLTRAARTVLSTPRFNPLQTMSDSLERGADAHRFMGERKNVGKVVLTV
jgi:hypothetical protein